MLRKKTERVKVSAIDEIITLATEGFITGHQNNIKVYEERAANDPTIPENKKKYNRFLTGWVSTKDQKFTYDATSIPNTNYIASAGPHNAAMMPDFLKNTAFNEHVSITRIVAFCDHLSDSEAYHRDFHEYCLISRGEDYGDFHVDTERLSGKITQTQSGSQVTVDSIVQSTLSIYPIKDPDKIKRLNVTVLPLRDNLSLKLEDVATKEVIWQLYQFAQKQHLLVHCTSGVGRTGHFIFTLEILRHHHLIFGDIKPEQSAKQILQILNQMREVRAGLVNTHEQFSNAIKNADILYQYAVRMKYLDAKKPAKIAPMLMDGILAKPDKTKETKAATPKLNTSLYKN